eukprot:scaffold3617_cov119-Isochrysis_galbana.AAC.6
MLSHGRHHATGMWVAMNGRAGDDLKCMPRAAALARPPRPSSSQSGRHSSSIIHAHPLTFHPT